MEKVDVPFVENDWLPFESSDFRITTLGVQAHDPTFLSEQVGFGRGI